MEPSLRSNRPLAGWLLVLALAGPLAGQVPLEQFTPADRIWAQGILSKPDFTFQSHSQPRHVRVRTMENLFDHPRLAAAMWRECNFVPAFYATELPNRGLTIDDGRGLRGTLTLTHRKPGLRVYLIEGRVDAWRMGNPVGVGAKMITVYRYWDGPQGFESHLQTWTSLDSALLGVMTRPFRKYIQRRQEEFITYILGNMAQGGAFAEVSPEEFRNPIRREGDPRAVRQFEEVFGGHDHR